MRRRAVPLAIAILAAALLGTAAQAAPRSSLDAELHDVLMAQGFTGTVGQSLEQRLGRPLDPALADLGRLLWFDKIGGLHSDNTCGGCQHRRTASATRSRSRSASRATTSSAITGAGRAISAGHLPARSPTRSCFFSVSRADTSKDIVVDVKERRRRPGTARRRQRARGDGLVPDGAHAESGRLRLYEPDRRARAFDAGGSASIIDAREVTTSDHGIDGLLSTLPFALLDLAPSGRFHLETTYLPVVGRCPGFGEGPCQLRIDGELPVAAGDPPNTGRFTELTGWGFAGITGTIEIRRSE